MKKNNIEQDSDKSSNQHTSPIISTNNDSNKKLFSNSIEDFFKPMSFTSEMINEMSKINDLKNQLADYPSKYKNLTNNKFIENKLSIDSEIVDLQKKLHEESKKLQKEKGARERREFLYKELEEKQRSSHILSRIHEDAGEKYLSSDAFKANFNHGNEVESVVISIDIRRSTDLMLKAKSPTDYSDFITGLSEKLSQIIIEHLGIFDKFTGDGILAFFPKFYSGENAIILALLAAQKCHSVFIDHYTQNRNKFTVHIKNVGLGIGIDYGKVSIANTTSELTVVGRPVVYACRFSGAKAGDTLLNLEALEQIEKLNHPMVKEIDETEIDIKNEGIATAFKIHLDVSKFKFDKEFPWKIFKNDYKVSELTKNDKDESA